MLCIVGRGAVEHSVGVDQSGWRWTEPDSGCGQSHAAVSAGCGLATEPDQPGKGIGRGTPGQLQPDSESDAHTCKQCHLAHRTTVGAGSALPQCESDRANIWRI